jgi:serine/threonine-protein kinase RsbT
MRVLSSVLMPIASSEDIVIVRTAVRKQSVSLGFNLIDQTKLVTASSELARNTLDYGGGGSARLEVIEDGRRTGIKVTFEDQGPGIPDAALALSDGYTSGNGMGLGLGGAKRLCHDFELRSVPGEGTLVSIARWK